jgi:lipopolysaccharide export system protein LptC
MAWRDNAYSRLVVWLKVLLPLAALVLLSSLFLVARTIDPMRAVTEADRDVEGLARDLLVGAPDFAGVTRDGSALRVTARRARPDMSQAGRMTAEGVNGALETPGGARYEISADSAMLDSPGGQVAFSGDVVLTSSSGYMLRTEGLTASLDETRLAAPGPVTGEGPTGAIAAGGMTLRPTTESEGGYVLVFNNGVKLVYELKPRE